MKVFKIGMITILWLGMMIFFAPQSARAEGLASGTSVTFEQPIEIPGKVLPAGTYSFFQDGSIVRIWDKDDRLLATLLTNSAEQQQFEPRQEFEFDSHADGSPLALKAWFFDSGMLGHEFIYSHSSK